MAKRGGLSQGFHVGGYDLSGDASSIIRCATPRVLLPATGLDKSAVERINGHAGGEIAFNTLFNDATDQQHAALKALASTDVGVMWLLRPGVGRGGVACAMTAKQASYDWARGDDKSLLGSVEMLSVPGFPLEWGFQLHDLTKETHTSGSNTASNDDNGAGSSNGLVAYLQVFSVTGTSVTITVQDSANDSTFATLVSFSAQTGRASERVSVSGTVDRYLRLASTGTFTEAIFAVVVRRGTAADEVDLS